MNLELKHLLPYIDNKVKSIDSKGNIRTVTIEHQTYDMSTVGWNHLTNKGFLINTHKLILIPLSDVEDYFLNIWNKTKTDKNEDVFDYTDAEYLSRHDDLMIETIYNTITEYLPVGLYNLLLKHHFDVFGLIPKGLAIDLNTIKN